MDFAEFMEIMKIAGEQLSEALGMDTSLFIGSFVNTFVIPLIVLPVLLIISFKIFNRTMFDRSDPSNVKRLPMNLNLEVKRMAFPVLLLATYTFARPIALKGFVYGVESSIDEIFRIINSDFFRLVINVIAPLIVSVPLIITAIRCARTSKYDLRRFLTLVPCVAIIMTTIGTAVALFFNILLRFDIESNIFIEIIFLAFSLALTFVSFITSFMFLVWICPQSLYEIFLGASIQTREDKRKIEEFRKGRNSGRGGSSGGSATREKSNDKPSKEKATFPATLRINGEIYHKIWASDEQGEYRNSGTGDVVHIWYTDLPDYE